MEDVELKMIKVLLITMYNWKKKNK